MVLLASIANQGNALEPAKATTQPKKTIADDSAMPPLFGVTEADSYIFCPYTFKAIMLLIPLHVQKPDEKNEGGFANPPNMSKIGDFYKKLLSEVNASRQVDLGPLRVHFNIQWMFYLSKPAQDAAAEHAKGIAKEVNNWAQSQTGGLIKELIPFYIDASTSLLFVDAMYFKGVWIEKFDPYQTLYYRFHLVNGRTIRAPFMTSTRKQYIREFDTFKILRLPINQSQATDYSMFIFIAKNNTRLEDLRKKIGRNEANFIRQHYPHELVDVGNFLIPKFKLTYDCDLPGFYKLSSAYIEVDEEGTIAAGASVCLLKPENPDDKVKKSDSTDSTPVVARPPPTNSSQSNKVDFVADSPFLAVIHEKKLGAIAFIGKVVNPLHNH